MKPKRFVYGSRSEWDVIRALQRKWEKTFSLHHNIPILNIIDVDVVADISPREIDVSAEKISLRDYDYLKKTSVDIVLCDKATEVPLICVEFDGWSLGFSKRSKYIPGKVDALRARKMEMKCKCFALANIPLFIVSSRETQPLDNATATSLLDGFIGQMWAGQQTWKEFASKLKSGDLSPSESHSKWYEERLYQHRYEHDPLMKEASSRLSLLLHNRRCLAPEVMLGTDNLLINSIASEVKSRGSAPYKPEYKDSLGISESEWARGIAVKMEDAPIYLSPRGESLPVPDGQLDDYVRENLQIGHRFELVTSRGIIRQESFIRTVEPIEPKDQHQAERAVYVKGNMIVVMPPLSAHINVPEAVFFIAQALVLSRLTKTFP